MLAEEVVKAMVQRRLDDGVARDVAYAQIQAVLDVDLQDLRQRAHDLEIHLQAAGEPHEYIEERLSAFSYMIDRQILLKYTARHLEHDGWPPPANQ